MRGAPFLNLVLAVALLLMAGWLLVVGRGLLLPIFTAVISVYILTAASDWLENMPVVGRLPGLVRHLLLLLGFTAVFLALGLVMAITTTDLLAAVPRYQTNLEALGAKLVTDWGVEMPDSWPTTWADIRAATMGRVNVQGVLVSVLGGLTSVGITAFLVVVYAGFLITERGGFRAKLAVAFPEADHAERLGAVVREINRKIGQYLAIKTLINVILGLMSYAILWAMDVDFALFWAVTIALFNYIPYVGSIIGVMFPVILSLAQFGDVRTTALLALMLIAAQTYVGNVLEPKMIGKQLNLSPLVVLVSLSVWASLWGLPGAILAIPLTSMVTIICASFVPTRFVAVLLAENVSAAPPVSPPPQTP